MDRAHFIPHQDPRNDQTLSRPASSRTCASRPFVAGLLARLLPLLAAAAFVLPWAGCNKDEGKTGQPSTVSGPGPASTSGPSASPGVSGTASPAAPAQPAAAPADVDAKFTVTLPDSAGQVAFVGDGQTVWTGYGQFPNDIQSWSATDGKPGAKFKVINGFLTLRTSPDGKYVAATGSTPNLSILDASTGKEAFSYRHDADEFGGNTVAWSADGKRIALSRGKFVRIWDVGTEKEPVKIDAIGDRVHSMAFSPDGSRLACCASGFGGSGAAVVCDSHSGAKQKQVPLNTSLPTWARFLDDNTLLAPRDQGVDVIDLASGKATQRIKFDAYMTSAASVSADGKRVALAPQSSGSTPPVLVFDVATGNQVASLKGHTDKVRGLAFSPDGKSVASASEDKTSKLFLLP